MKTKNRSRFHQQTNLSNEWLDNTSRRKSLLQRAVSFSSHTTQLSLGEAAKELTAMMIKHLICNISQLTLS